jgi:hypothetical protein
LRTFGSRPADDGSMRVPAAGSDPSGAAALGREDEVAGEDGASLEQDRIAWRGGVDSRLEVAAGRHGNGCGARGGGTRTRAHEEQGAVDFHETRR